MDMQDFYKKYNLNKYDFGELAGVGTRTLIKYAEGKSIRKDAKNRIELAIHTVIKHDLKRPSGTGIIGKDLFGRWELTKFHKELEDYKKEFKQYLEIEGSN